LLSSSLEIHFVGIVAELDSRAWPMKREFPSRFRPGSSLESAPLG